jgi:hypothetical protein
MCSQVCCRSTRQQVRASWPCSHRVSQVPLCWPSVVWRSCLRRGSSTVAHSASHLVSNPCSIPYFSSRFSSSLAGSVSDMSVGFALVPQAWFALGFQPLFQTLLPCGSNTFAGKRKSHATLRPSRCIRTRRAQARMPCFSRSSLRFRMGR